MGKHCYFTLIRNKIATISALSAVIFVLLTSGFGQFNNLVQRPIFLLLVIILGFSLFPSKTKSVGWKIADIIFIVFSVIACTSVIWRSDLILTSLPFANTSDVILIGGLLVSIFVLMQRLVGWAFPLLVFTSLGYALYGNFIPGDFGHRGFDIRFLTESIYLGDLGLWGLLTGVAATTIAPFVLLGSMILNTGGGQTFMDIAMRVSGRSPGGAAKMATVASGLFGMVSGSAVANVATTGNLTINLMKDLKYPPKLAGAVEAVASTGGQLAPPIMGAAAFIMAELVGMSYLDIATAAILPAALFYGSIFLIIHLIALRWELPLIPENDMPKWSTVLSVHRILPLVLSITSLIIAVFSGRSIAFSAYLGTVTLLISYLILNIRSLDDIKNCKISIMNGVRDAGIGFVTITVLLAGAQILVSMINLTGLGVTLSSTIVSTFSSTPFVAPFVVAMACLVLGMGVPTTAAYILVASILAPAMIRIGFDPLPSHLFVLYFAALSAITPPVCVAVFVASSIAKTPWFDVAKEAVRISIVTFIIPFIFLFMPGVLGQGDWPIIIFSIIRAFILTTVVAFFASGWTWSKWGLRGLFISIILTASMIYSIFFT
ncbi:MULTISPECIES: TRAP transporter permease [Vibrio]|uniref:TRAP transporter permease n=1 Tax=Vibrio TaxID=662 RepID=UPI000D33E777|nr:TRAP transporter fused permease subunit [Vibrio splendidus]PTP66109.1 C4-dicarboxylate ABC transporter permease [Vibrio splendidus]